MAAQWRVVILTQVPEVAQGYAAIARALGHEPVAVVSARRRRRGAPVGRWNALLATETPDGLDVAFAESKRSLARLFRAYEADLVLCTGFPWLIPADAIAVPRLGIVNGHPSLLPEYRGPHPIAWAIRNGEDEIGLSYHLVDERFDTGPLLAQARIRLEDGDTMETLTPRLAAASQELLPVVFERLARGDSGDMQEGGAYQSLFEEKYAFVDPSLTAAQVHRQVWAWRFVPFVDGEHGPILERDGGRIRLLRTSLADVEGAERLECGDAPLWIVESEPA